MNSKGYESVASSNNELVSIATNDNRKINSNKITWLVQKLSELKYDPNRAVPFYFKDDVLVTILMCLICKKNSIIFDVNENQKPFKNMLEKIIFSIFGFSYSSYRCKPTTTSNELISGILNRIKGKNEVNNQDMIGNSTLLRTEESLADKKANSMPDLNKTPIPTDESINNKYRGSTLNINNNDENVTNKLLGINSQVVYSNIMIKNIYDNKLEMIKNNYNYKTSNSKNGSLKNIVSNSNSNTIKSFTTGRRYDLIHKLLQPPDTDNNKEVVYNTNTLSRLNLENKNNDFAMMDSDDLIDKAKNSLIKLSSQTLPNVIIIENLDDASPIVQDAILQILVKKKIFNDEFPSPFIIISLISKPDIQNNVISRLLNKTFLYHRIKENISHSVPIYLSNDALITEDEIQNLISDMDRITISKYIDVYIRDIMTGIRTHPLISSGVPVNSTKDLILATKALSALFEQTYMTVDHIQIALKHVLSHRMNLVHHSTHVSKNFKNQYCNITAGNILADVLNNLPIK